MKYTVIYARYSSDSLTKEDATAIEKEMDEYCMPCSKMVECSPPKKRVL